MILKELDPFRGNPDDVGARIEADRMAYALRRHYRNSRDIDVLNGLVVGSGNSVAEVDHLILHGYGLLVLEREPLKGRVRIDGDGQWLVWPEGRPVRLPSPITRAYVQALMLKALLDRRVQQRGYFDQLELDVLVVVDDDCIPEWPSSGPLAEVCRREDVAQRVEQRVAQCRNTAIPSAPLSQSERRKLGEFLIAAHAPARGLSKERQ